MKPDICLSYTCRLCNYKYLQGTLEFNVIKLTSLTAVTQKSEVLQTRSCTFSGLRIIKT